MNDWRDPGYSNGWFPLFHFKYDGPDETRINNHLASIFVSLGDRFAGDEKLFKFAGKSGYVRLVPNKPAKVELWNFQGTVILGSGFPFLVYNRLNMLFPETKRTMKCVEIVQDWGELIKDKDGKKKRLFMDSYYLTRDGAKWLHENKVMYVGSIKKNHFFSLCSVLEPHLVKSGTSKIAYNRSTGESVTYVWSENSKLGKKYVHSNGYKLKKKPKKDTSCAP